MYRKWVFLMVFLLTAVAYSELPEIVQPKWTYQTEGCPGGSAWCFEQIAGIKAGDLLDVTQEKAEKKWWITLLNWYNTGRKIAAATLEDINAVMNVVQSVQSQVNAIECLFIRIEDLAKTYEQIEERLKTFDWEKLYTDPAGVVTMLEEDIFQKTDGMLMSVVFGLRSDVKGILVASENIRRSTVNVGRLVQRQFGDTTVRIRNLATNSGEVSWLAWMNDAPWLGWVVAEEREAKSKYRHEQLWGAIQKAADSGSVNQMLLADLNRMTRRNDLILSLEKHEFVGDNITRWSELLLQETEGLSVTNNQRLMMVTSILKDMGYGEEE